MIAGFILLVFGLSSTHKQAWALDPVLTTPPPGSEISTATITFGWNAGDNVDEYWLEVGTGSSGTASRDIFNASTGLSTSQEVTGIPLDGNPVYVKVWWRIQADWLSAPYAYTTPPPADTSITSPPDTSELSTALVNFQWTDNGATQYWLEVGTGPGLKDIFNASTGLATLQNVPITLNGSPVYARVWWLIGGVWSVSAEVSYTTTVAAIAITNPPLGSTISNSTVTFAWTNNGADEYWLVLGTGSGLKDIYDLSTGLSTSQEVTDIPLDGGTIYVGVFYRVGTDWFEVPTTYDTLAPEMTSPAPGSDLTEGTVNFQWNGVDGEDAYWLEVGTTEGGNDIFNSGNIGLTTSQEVTGIPLDGNDVYVRLWWKIGGIWESRDYVYGTTIPSVEMTLPVPGSILTTSTVTFEWTGPIIVVKYQLGVGTSLEEVDGTNGFGDIHTPADIFGTSQEVTGIPLDGNTVYVRLWYLIGAVWDSVDYQYQTEIPAAAPVAQTGQTTCYDSAGTVIDCADTGQDGDIQAGVAWPSPRFRDNGDGTVRDNLTGKIWTKDADLLGIDTWANALAFCNGLIGDGSVTNGPTDGSVAGDWHLSNFNELWSIFDKGRESPSLPSGHPFTNPSTWYWTSTTDFNSLTDAYTMKVSETGLVSRTKSGANAHAWCVRGGE